MATPTSLSFTSPLSTSWSPQYVRLSLRGPGINPWTPMAFWLDGEPADFQYTGQITGTPNAPGVEVLIRLGFEKGQTRKLVFAPADAPAAPPTRKEISLEHEVEIGFPIRPLAIPANDPAMQRPGSVNPSIDPALDFPVSEFKGKQLGRILHKMGKVTRGQLQEALLIQSQRKVPIGHLLIELGYATLDVVDSALAYQAGTSTAFPSKPTNTPVVAPGPLAGFGGFPLASSVTCPRPLVSRRLYVTNAGPLFRDYVLEYEFAENRRYKVEYRCYVHEPVVEIAENIGLGMDSRLGITFNPTARFDRILSHVGFEFEGDGQPTDEPLAMERPKDVLCRLQMPPLGEFVVPNNRGYFSFYKSDDEQSGMLGMMGLYGGKWTRAVENIMPVHVAHGTAALDASLNGGNRYWLLYAGPVQKGFSPTERFVFHRLHGEFNALRLDEHLDLAKGEIFDANTWNKPGLFDDNSRATAIKNAKALPPLQRFLAKPFPGPDAGGSWMSARTHLPLHILLNTQPPAGSQPPASDFYKARLHEVLVSRFQLWVEQFQGFRLGQADYAKNVIGFTRMLRGLMIGYELLRKENFFSAEQLRELNSYFVFAARRIMDEGRWPHSHTWQHPDHPDSTRDIYFYPGEHRPDRLVWTNCLPNFQSDPMCALAHLAALIPEHPDANHWLQFALDDIDRQLDGYAGKSGAWAESINYALYTLSYFVITFRIVKNRMGIDYFNDPRVRRLASWLVRFFGPNDKRWNSHTYPGVGNSSLPQGGGEYLLAFAGELPVNDPLRHDLLSIYQKLEKITEVSEHYPTIMAIMSPPMDREYPIRALESENMDEVGVAMRDRHTQSDESYLFQKIGFAKDHYEGDETSFNWYAKGTPLAMDYGTYTGDVASSSAHNLIEIPDMDSLRRGYLGNSFFSKRLDFTHCEVPVILKLSHGKIRTFAEVDGPPVKPLFFYLGDENPVGPKTWVTRSLLFVKPDYVVLFDHVFGAVPHRFNLHVTANDIRREGLKIHAAGRFDLDLLCHVQHPAAFEMSTGELVPSPKTRGENNEHRQKFFRLYNTTDNSYRTVLFAKERDRDVTIENIGTHGVRITTAQYTDIVYLHNTTISDGAEGTSFTGKSGWIRKTSDGQIQCAVVDGDSIAGFGVSFHGRGPWSYNTENDGRFDIRGTPRVIRKS